jgi:branched-chain amino acid transport system permease protein
VAAFAEFALNGVFLGAVFGLLAFAMALVWLTTDVIDIATGGYAVTAGLVAHFIGGPAGLVTGLAAAVALSAVTGGIFLLFRSIGGARDTIIMVLCTIALSFAIESALQTVFGTDARFVRAVSGAADVAGVFLSHQGLTNITLALVVVAVVLATLKWSPAGLLMRASAISAKAASLAGIPVRRVQFLTFLLSGAIAGGAGLLAAMTSGVSYNSAFPLSLVAFSGTVLLVRQGMAVAFGGGLVLGIATALGQAYLPTGWDAATAPLLIILVLCSGLFPTSAFHGARP